MSCAFGVAVVEALEVVHEKMLLPTSFAAASPRPFRDDLDDLVVDAPAASRRSRGDGSTRLRQAAVVRASGVLSRSALTVESS